MVVFKAAFVTRQPCELAMKRTDNESSRKAGVKWTWILGLVVLIVAAVLLLLNGKTGKSKGVNPLAALYMHFSEDTRFASGYSEKGFYSIKVGDGETRVTNLLGTPVQTWSNEVWTAWAYASGPIPDFAWSGEIGMEVDYTQFMFDGSGRVKSVHGQVSGGKHRGILSTSASILMGNGMNFLQLSNDRIEELKGKRFAEIEALFGKPMAVRESRAVKVLRYSDSPSSKNYRKRSIGVDAQGKVVEVDDGYYWD
jgi:hypothetical protein